MIGVIPSGNNLASVTNALDRLGAAWALVESPEDAAKAAKLVLPGVGAAAAAMERLRAMDLVATLRAWDRPLLGICIGMQLFFEGSEEGAVQGDPVPLLGLLPGVVRRLAVTPAERLPHMGWSPVGDEHYYFVHGYRVPDGPWTERSAWHGEPFPAQIAWKNLRGAQFHPERSGPAGARYLERFVTS